MIISISMRKADPAKDPAGMGYFSILDIDGEKIEHAGRDAEMAFHSALSHIHANEKPLIAKLVEHADKQKKGR